MIHFFMLGYVFDKKTHHNSILFRLINKVKDENKD